MSSNSPLLVASLLAVAFGCSASINTVPRSAHQSGGTSWVVPEPPPPVEVEEHAQEEIARAESDADCAWLAGQWLYDTGQWNWQGGRWVRVPPHCSYADPEMHYRHIEGQRRLVYRPGQFYSSEPDKNCKEIAACRGLAPDGSQ
jgi:hypothetical protein